MFFFIFTFPKKKSLGYIRMPCACCAAMGDTEIIEIQNLLVLLFVPIPLGKKKYILYSPNCSHQSEISYEQAQELLHSHALIPSLHAQKEAKKPSCRCAYCFKQADASFTYCPYCGNPL